MGSHLVVVSLGVSGLQAFGNMNLAHSVSEAGKELDLGDGFSGSGISHPAEI